MQPYTVPILIDHTLDRQLLAEGYVVVPFLGAPAVQDLIAFFNAHHPQGINGFYATAHVTDITFRKQMNQKIREVFAEPIAHYFNQCKPLGGSFVVKGPTQQDKLNPHQDWNIVDEDVFRSFNIWVPLVDLNDTNGIIKVTPQSHAWLKTYRGPGLPDVYQPVQNEIWAQMKPLYMKAGEALIYDHRLIHASDPNRSNGLRLAAVYGIIPQTAAMYYYYGNNGQVEVYESNVDFFLEGNIQEGNKRLTQVKIFPQPAYQLDTAALTNLLKYKTLQAPTQGFFARLAKLWR